MGVMESNSLSIVNYQAGSYIMVENQPNSKKNEGAFFILRSGKVQVESLVDQMLGQPSNVLQSGSFFGIVSAMSEQESTETAIALTDCSLIVVTKNTFGNLVMGSPAIALKIIRALSTILRHYDDELAARMIEAQDKIDNSENLFHTGEFFYNNKNYKYAAQIFAVYIESYTNNARKEQAQKYLDEMQVDIKQQEGFSRSYEDGDMICSEYMPGKEIYIIQEGKVKITKILNEQEVILAILETGDIVGEMSLLNNKERTANIIAYGKAQIMALEKDNFENIIMKSKELSTKLLAVLSERLWTIYKQLANLLIEDPISRLWDTLFTQILKQHILIDHQAKHEFSFGKQELLNMCGFSEEAGENAFEEVLACRWMSLTDEGKILCNNLEELRKTVESAHKMEIRKRKMRMAKP